MKKMLKIINNIEEYVLMFLLVLMGIVITVQVFFRFVLNYPLFFTEEIASFCFIWITMIGISYCVKNHLHSRVDVFTNMLSAGARKVIYIASDLFCIGVFLYMLPTAVSFNITQSRLPSGALQVPMSVVYTSVVVGILLTLIRLAINVIETITGKKLIKEEEAC